MKINPIWALCIIIRIVVIFISMYISTNREYNIRLTGGIILLSIGIGFLIKSLTGSNNEVQLSKVFWHDSRLVHGILYILAAYYLYIEKPKICGIVLGLDILFSILYRILTNK
jgi:hypothetical protein